MTDDRGLAALAERLRKCEGVNFETEGFAVLRASSEDDLAAAILGEHGLFLPDGDELSSDHGEHEAAALLKWAAADARAGDTEAEVERLRAALARARRLWHLANAELAREAVRLARAALAPEEQP